MLDLLRQRGFEVDTNTFPPRLLDIDDERVVLVVGGDGTLHGAFNALGDKGVDLAVFPAGLFNTFCRTYSLPCSACRIFEAIVGGTRGSVPVGIMGKTLFLSNLSIGYKAAVAEDLGGGEGLPRGLLSYVKPLVRALIGLRVRRLYLRCDGSESEMVDTPLLCVAPDREGKRPFLRLYIVAGKNRLKFLIAALAVFLALPLRRDVDLPGLRCIRATEMEIEGDMGAVNLDGEVYYPGTVRLQAGFSGVGIIGIDPSFPIRHKLLLR